MERDTITAEQARALINKVDEVMAQSVASAVPPPPKGTDPMMMIKIAVTRSGTGTPHRATLETAEPDIALVFVRQADAAAVVEAEIVMMDAATVAGVLQLLMGGGY